MRTALFTGTFNPFTLGHANIVERALRLFDHVVIGVGYNPAKTASQTASERAEAIRRLYEADPRVTVEAFTDMTADLAVRHGAVAVVKGVRSVQDYEYERSQAEYNRMLGNGLETVLLPALPELASLSSSAVRTLKAFGRDVTALLPEGYDLTE